MCRLRKETLKIASEFNNAQDCEESQNNASQSQRVVKHLGEKAVKERRK